MTRLETLEAKIPPPAVAAAIALAMWLVSQLAPPVVVSSALRLSVAAALVVVGIAFSAAGVLAFRRAKTTIHPGQPDRASSLVSGGVYRITRNPMYVGLACVLVGWAVLLSSGWALLGPLAFVLYVGRFQIEPEERALAKLFGDDYAAYRAKVRRWL